MQQLDISHKHVYNTLRKEISPIQPTGRFPMPTDYQIDELENSLCRVHKNRQMTYLELAVGLFKHWGLSENTIERYLRKKRYDRFRAVIKPRLAEKKNWMKKRAEDYPQWSVEDWEKILWSFETSVADSRFTSKYAIGKAGSTSICLDNL